MRLNPGTFRTRALTLSIRGVVQRFSHFLLIGMAAILMLIGQMQPQTASRMRMAFVDVFAPFMAVAASPAAHIRELTGTLQDILHMDTKLAQMRQDNMALSQWRDAAMRLKAENDSLRALLNYKPEPQATSLTARVLAGTEDSLGHNMIVLAGTVDGVHPDAAAVTDRGLLGRLLEVGSRTARIMLLTDITSRIPVWVEKNHDRAILAGSNDGAPTLLYLPADADILPGDRIVTSGNGGIFPTGIPVGVISAIRSGHVEVSLFADPNHTDYVRIVDYSAAIPRPDDDDADTDDSSDQTQTQETQTPDIKAAQTKGVTLASKTPGQKKSTPTTAPVVMQRSTNTDVQSAPDSESGDTGDEDR